MSEGQYIYEAVKKLNEKNKKRLIKKTSLLAAMGLEPMTCRI